MVAASNQRDYLYMKEFEAFLEVLSFVAFVGLGVMTLLIWRRRKDPPSFWVFVTFADLALVVIAGRILEIF